jgi:phytoene desaturase
VVVVGGGIGGLAAAIRLRAAGHPVTLVERNSALGGKLAAYEREGFTFDVGPSLLTLPHVFDEVFELAGTSLADQVELVRLDPQFRYRWTADGGSSLDVHDQPDATAAAFERLVAGAGDRWRSFEENGRTIWEIAARTFFAGPMSNPMALVRRIRSPGDLTGIDSLRTLHRRAAAEFDDPRLVQWAGRYATYSGSSPFEAPATLACIPHVESRFGCWYPIGGLGALTAAIERTAHDIGVEIRTSTEARRVTTTPDQVTGVELDDGEVIDAQIVVANTDAEHLYRDLLPDAGALRRVRRAERSTSGFVMCLGVDGESPGIGHHNVWFSDDERGEFDQLASGRLAEQPTIYGCISSFTDRTQAPAGCENWFLLVNTPPDAEVDPDRYGDVVLERLREFDIDLLDRKRFTWTMTPADIADRYRAPGGAIYGTSSNGRRAAFVRPANRGVRRGLYLVGGSSHPGGGLPLVTMSARIVAEMVAADGLSS